MRCNGVGCESRALKQVRTQLIETARPVLEAMIESVAEAKVVSLHHDISTVTGEELLIFTLAGPPPYRESRKR
ncbi:MAG TPA: Na-translocating system protein MpsC family protein [Pirellulaceae bacterium]|nr:Na-translocating system protein MpsC family protein [Pirellulaceae bacterium]